MKITLAQLNPFVGDIDGNVARIEETLRRCRGESPDLVVFPELFLVGYPPAISSNAGGLSKGRIVR